MKNIYSYAYLSLAVLSLLSCAKGPNGELYFGYGSAIDNATGETVFNDLLDQADAVAADAGTGTTLDACIENVTTDMNVMPHTMLISYGAANCAGVDGRNRRGSILVTFNGPYDQEGTVITITPQEYFVNDQKVQGTETVTNLAPDTDGNPARTVTVAGTVTTADNSATSTYNANRVRTWVAGDDTETLFDDVFLITGSGTGTDRAGQYYTMGITQALRVQRGCAWLVSGKLSILPNDGVLRAVDHGSGSCDNDISVIVDGNTYYFTGQ